MTVLPIYLQEVVVDTKNSLTNEEPRSLIQAFLHEIENVTSSDSTFTGGVNSFRLDHIFFIFLIFHTEDQLLALCLDLFQGEYNNY